MKSGISAFVFRAEKCSNSRDLSPNAQNNLIRTLIQLRKTSSHRCNPTKTTRFLTCSHEWHDDQEEIILTYQPEYVACLAETFFVFTGERKQIKKPKGAPAWMPNKIWKPVAKTVGMEKLEDLETTTAKVVAVKRRK
jgi:hypothetical protein